ncbi:ArgS-related anticodon-binding protein NrtL [Streptomyces sp. NPDC020801]|uniref:ArgS-related anticodon-binding protein NrtL n=1 Tax=unclassified Streptomyces TaxID=2593676 RepID=UPI0037BCB60E
MTPVELSRTVLRAVRRAVDVGELRVAVPERALVTRPRPGGCGDYATNIALQLARPAGQPPRRVAEVLRSHLAGLDGIDDVSVTGPGFLNISLRQAGAALAVAEVVEEIRRRGPRYGFAEGPSGQVIQLHCACEVRAVVVTDTVARLLRSQGALVRTSCDGPPPPEWGPGWEDVLGARLDVPCAPGAPPSPLDVDVRPAPAPADPVPLGRDAGRWALLRPAGHDRPRIDADEHLVQRESNPLFRVRYAHARTRALARNAADLGFAARPGAVTDAEPLLTLLADHPRVLARAAEHRAPDVLARHLVTVADAVLPVLPTVLPAGEEKPSAAHRARLALAEAAGTVLAGGLSLLGIDAPDHL